MLADTEVISGRASVAQPETVSQALKETASYIALTQETRTFVVESVPAPAPSTLYHSWKPVVDRVTAFGLLILFTPVILVCAALVRLTSRGPAFYWQMRLGRNGTPFLIYKLRTMVHDCEKTSGPRWSVPGDPRITTLGWFLRKTHLDELPQLWNVLRGDLSMVGPRPERPEFVPKLAERIAGYHGRLSVKPGITGLAQVYLPADTDLDSVRRKLAHDLHYVQRMGLWLDLRLMACTAFRMVGVPTGPLAALLLIPRPRIDATPPMITATPKQGTLV